MAADTFRAVTDDGTYEFTLSSNANTISIDIEHWAPGLDPDVDNPSDTQNERLTNVTALGDVITAKGPWGSMVIFTLSATNASPSIGVRVKAFLHNSNETYPLAPADRAGLGAFVAQAGFPAA